MKAIALFSGGLDSMLAIKVIQEQGIEVIAVNFNIGFGSTEDRREHMQKVADEVGVELVIIRGDKSSRRGKYFSENCLCLLRFVSIR